MEALAIFYAMIGFELFLRKTVKLDGPPFINEMVPTSK
jgi:hypothetical protein